MRIVGIALGVAAATLGGCTVRHTTVARAQAEPPVVYEVPVPAVVDQAPPSSTVVFQQQPPALYNAPSYNVAVTYTGVDGLQLAWQRATTYCVAHYGNSRVRLVTDDPAAGRAMFACDQLSPPPTVAYQPQQPVMYSPPSDQGVSVTYKGPNGFQLAWQKAGTYCVAHYGNTRVRLVSDDRAAGHAVFACDTL